MSENQANPAGAGQAGEPPSIGGPMATPHPGSPASHGPHDNPSSPAPGERYDTPAPPAVAGPQPPPPAPTSGSAAPSPAVPQAPPPAADPAASPTTAQPYPTTAQTYSVPPYAYSTPSQPTHPYPPTSQPYPGTSTHPGQPYPAFPPNQPPAGGGTAAAVIRRRVIAGVAALAIGLTGGLVGGYVGYELHPGSSSPLQVIDSSGNHGNAAPVIDRSSLSSIAAALQPAIVDIKTSDGEGSGVIISADGYIATNNHVVTGARTVTVTFNSGSQVSAKVVGTDPETDLAVVKVDADNLVFAKWADSDAVQVGDTVLALGSPLGLQGSVTAGIVSGLHRTITSSQEQRSQFDPSSATTIGDAIQTDAPINSGNSGGALVNMNGEVVGINTAIATAGTTGNIGVGFAISSNRAKTVTEALIAGNSVQHPYLGVRIQSASSGGAEVAEVVDGSAAAQAGIHVGDVITKFGDRTIRGPEDLIGAIQGSTVGAQVPVTVVRDGNEQTLSVTVGEQ